MARKHVVLAPWCSWSADSLTSEIRNRVERIRVWPDVERLVTLSDVHLSGKSLNGAVLATRDRIYPGAIGADIGCGMMTLPLQTTHSIETNEPLRQAILSTWQRGIPILKTAADNAQHLPDPSQLSDQSLRNAAERDGAWQLGTLGRGNHFLELQVDSDGAYWLLVHSGSRAMGQVVTSHHESAAESNHSQLRMSDEFGQAYLEDMRWCRQYACGNRNAILRRAVELIADLIPMEADFQLSLGTDHNHLEVHNDLLVHRKGAQGLKYGGWGVIPGSMAAPTFHVTGRGCEKALDSCSHDAGRRFSRTDASKNLGLRDVRRSLEEVTFDESRLGSLVDEAPAAYRDIEAVLRAQRDLVKRTLELRPLLTLKGGR
jgi:tRNA-splicing ligase RtcB (3'-phosphate/5'-hydroxy nucleic acid ligase)